ncbi:7-dehydrocholesterol reductase [Aphelenchoides fujianensis]|nr:7-dehydrocholesterol reductase [Aphelenchoides fujianensis]
MLRLNRRRSSSASNGSAVFVNRRSSLTSKDIAYIESVINRTKRTSTHLILFLCFLPALVFAHFYYTLVYDYKGNVWKLMSPLKWRRFMPRILHPFPWLFVFGTIPVHLRLYPAHALMDFWSGVMFANLVLVVLIQFYLFYVNAEDESTECERASSSQPSNPDNLVRDFWFGQQLQPIVWDMCVKGFVTNRMMCSFWATYLVAAFAKQRFLFDRTSGGFLVVAGLQFVYLCRRLFLDPCSPDSCDNQSDRAGFYRLWGVLVLLPTVYLTPTDSSPSPTVCVLLFLCGLIAQLFTGAIDAQKIEFRQQNGAMKINDQDPFFIVAKFRRETGEGATNLLLGSGFWGVARHLNYTAEWLSFAFWTPPVQTTALVAYFPLLFLALLLLNRVSRDEVRCLLKYHQNWIQYTNRVPFRLVPGVY